MRIQSKVKDYYDYVEHVYGGGDPKLIYKRIHIMNTEFPYSIMGNTKLGFWCPDSKEQTVYVDGVPRTEKTEYIHVVVCGRLYIVEKITQGFEVISYRLIEKRSDDIESRRLWHYTEYEMGKYYPQFDAIAKYIKHPVFEYTGRHFSMCRVSYDIPNLGEMGFGKYIQPEIMYQNIAHYIGNVINHGVDLEPPVKVEDKHRILQHGFDLKQSFRHRK